MKRVLFIVLCLAIAKADLLTAQQIDWENAPLNPIAKKYLLQHFNLKKDVYLYGYQTFDKKGRLQGDYLLSNNSYYYANNHTVVDDFYSYELDKNGLVLSGTSHKSGVKAKSYFYDTYGNLIRKFDGTNGKQDNTYYKYDTEQRVISQSQVVDGVEKLRINYTYEKTRNGLKIILTNVLKNFIQNIEVWNKGLLVQKKKQYGDQMDQLINELDNKGNVVSTRKGARIFKKSLLYYKDLKKDYQLVVQRVTDKKPMFGNMYEGYRLGVNCEDITAIEVGNDAVFFDPYQKSYWRLKDGFKRDKNAFTNYDVAQIPKNKDIDLDLVTVGEEYLLIKARFEWKFVNNGAYDMYAKEIEVGNDVLIIAKGKDGKLQAFLAYEISSQEHGSVSRVKLLKDSPDLIYAYILEASNLRIYDQGKEIDYTNAKWGKLVSGESLLFVNSKPKYIFPVTKDLTANKLVAGHRYAGESIKL